MLVSLTNLGTVHFMTSVEIRDAALFLNFLRPLVKDASG